jgi:D-alanyl-D-alanine carboxypeptidase
MTAARRAQALFLLLPVLVLAACAQQGGYGPGGRLEIGAEGWRRPTHYYPPPGPPDDPWGPYVREAAERFRVPGRWVRAVMHQESGGEQQATSPVGAMGLMQVMPATYEGLRERYQLGDDPYDPHNNILAGTAYIR